MYATGQEQPRTTATSGKKCITPGSWLSKYKFMMKRMGRITKKATNIKNVKNSQHKDYNRKHTKNLSDLRVVMKVFINIGQKSYIWVTN